MKTHCAKLRPAHVAGVGENGGEVDAGGGRLRDKFTGCGIAHRNAVIVAALPSTAYIALQVHKFESSRSRGLGWSAQARTTSAEMRNYRTGGCGHGHVIDSMVRAARYFGGRGGQTLAARSRRDELDTGARRHHWFAVGIAREGEGAVRECENDSAVTHAIAIDHVRTHRHAAFASPAN